MKWVLLTVWLFFGLGSVEADPRVLPRVSVHEWGVLSFCGPDLFFSGIPETGPSALFPSNDPGVVLRAPVLYFHGPEFSGTVTVRTGNGVVSAVYPAPDGGGEGLPYCSWTCRFDYASGSLPDAPFPYSLWRTGESMAVHTPGTSEGFLYYETDPATVGFLPYPPGTDYRGVMLEEIQALVIRYEEERGMAALIPLSALTSGEEWEFRDLDPDEIHNTLWKWSRDLIDIDEVDALWRTWSVWICGGFRNSPDYTRGLVVYRVPEDLLERLSQIEVTPESPAPYPVEVRRYILAAVPLY